MATPGGQEPVGQAGRPVGHSVHHETSVWLYVTSDVSGYLSSVVDRHIKLFSGYLYLSFMEMEEIIEEKTWVKLIM